MAKIYTMSELVEVASQGATPPNCDITLQLKMTEAKDGVARGQWSVDERFTNGIGVAMGGYLAAAADSAMAYALASKLGQEQTFTTIDLHTTFHRPANPGIVEVEARVERLGGKVAYVVADLTQNGKKVTSVVSSVMIMQR